MSKVIVALTGFAQSGKSLAADHLVRNLGFSRMPLAEPIKQMWHAVGVPERNLWGDQKEVPLEMLCGKSARQVMQWTGTELGRGMIGEELWIRLLRKRLAESESKRVVVDDVRFDNEARALRDMGALIVEIRRPTLAINGMTYKHESEAGVNIRDVVIRNDGTPDLLRQRINWLMSEALGISDVQEAMFD